MKSSLFNSEINKEYSSIKPVDEGFVNKTFLNANQTGNLDGVSSIKFIDEENFVLLEKVGKGVTEIKGQYGREGDVLMFSYEDDLYDQTGEKVLNFEFHIVSNKALEIMRDLEVSSASDVFTIDGMIPENFTPQFRDNHKVTVKSFVHSGKDDTRVEYLPVINLYSDHSFIFTENFYEGMGDISGTYQEFDDRFV